MYTNDDSFLPDFKANPKAWSIAGCLIAFLIAVMVVGTACTPPGSQTQGQVVAEPYVSGVVTDVVPATAIDTRSDIGDKLQFCPVLVKFQDGRIVRLNLPIGNGLAIHTGKFNSFYLEPSYNWYVERVVVKEEVTGVKQ